MSARRVKTSHLGSARKNVPSRLKIHAQSARDGTFLRAEPRWDVFTRRAEIGCFYTPRRDGMFFLRAEPR